MFVFCACYVSFLCRGFCDELIACPVESYLLLCVVMCDLELSRKRNPWPALGRSATGWVVGVGVGGCYSVSIARSEALNYELLLSLTLLSPSYV